MRTFTTLLLVLLWIILGNYLLTQKEAFWFEGMFNFYQLICVVFFACGVYNFIKIVEEDK